ncbi:hypothetical protein HDU83_003359 [Entophlyctis luteolus]|nr:hypothetical protein HDU83_003359 [Entophlyctis luteolus]
MAPTASSVPPQVAAMGVGGDDARDAQATIAASPSTPPLPAAAGDINENESIRSNVTRVVVSAQQQQQQQQALLARERDRADITLRRRVAGAGSPAHSSGSAPTSIARPPAPSTAGSSSSVSDTDFGSTTNTDTDLTDSSAPPSGSHAFEGGSAPKIRRRRKKTATAAAHSPLSQTMQIDSQHLSWIGWISGLFGLKSEQRLRPHSATAIPRPVRSVVIPRKTLVLDLDETLVHSTSMGSRHHDHTIEFFTAERLTPFAGAAISFIDENYMLSFHHIHNSTDANQVLQLLQKPLLQNTQYTLQF